MLLGEQRWPDLDRQVEPPLLLVPVGSCEQHGFHLPLDTDSVIAQHVANTASTRTTIEVAVTPAITISASGEHQGFSGTLSIGTAALTHVLIELVRSADWSGGVVIVNGHGGNHEAIREAQRRSHADGRRRVAAWSPTLPPGYSHDLHAGFVETSAMLAIRPDLVAPTDDIEASDATVACYDRDRLRREGVRAVSASGVLGDPTGADADVGEQFLNTWAGDLVTHIERCHAAWNRSNP